MTYIAVDIGASSGRLVLGEMKNAQLEIKEIHRFANGFMDISGTCYWDIDHLLNEILKGLEKVKSLGIETCTVGIDTWAVDYVLVGHERKRLREVVSYRDSRTKDTIEKIIKQMPKEKIYQKTGIQFQPFNTLYQLYEEEKEKLKDAQYILMVPDFLAFCLTGRPVAEKTNASTTQLLNLETKSFDEELLQLLSVKKEQFPELTEPGTELGEVRREWFPTFDLPKCTVITVATHDTASAVIGTPGFGDNWAYLSSGTWSLLGIESEVPVVSNLALKNNYTNEWGAFHTIRFLKNIIGMWIIQEVRRFLKKDYNFGQFVEEAKKENGAFPYINFNDKRFLNPANMIEEIQSYCCETNQQVPETAGELAYCIYNNLAIIYAIAMEELQQITGKRIDQLHIVGGGAYNEYLNQLTADFSGKTVYAGPTEATAIGNLVMQMIAMKEIEDLQAARQLIRDSFEIKKYTPNHLHQQTIMEQFKEVTTK
ncbi:rhamnulokinase [Cytobacillus sp. Hz8]|uniref:rhamnulokinase n=1 Tax=Cytobacillus sp. Hz8 TaxID=3347168 RepID=UPI0035E30B57